MGDAESVSQAHRDPRVAKSKVIVLAVDMTLDSWVVDIEQLKAGYPNTPLLVLSHLQDRKSVKRALLAGANGYLVKWASVSEFLQAVNLVKAGGCYLHIDVLSHVISELRTGHPVESRDE